MAANRQFADKQDKIQTYNKQIQQLRELQTIMNQTAMASGQWHTQTVKNISASQAFTQDMMKQNITMRQAMGHIREMRRGYGALNEAIKEQHALRNAMSTQMTSNVFGRNATDMFLPRNLGNDLEMARTKYGMINQLIASAAAKTINWGKNTQWAGRQITVGLTVPLGIAAVGAAALALKVDQNLTRIAKVYDTVNKGGMAQEQELADLREQSLETATRLAQEYGQNMQDVLDIEAQLAATGLNGPALHQATAEAARIATLGEMEYQKAVDMTVSLQTAFKLSTTELTEAFNMMNAVENATSLSIQDIADAVPRAASALASLGGTVEEMTVMLTAMKEAGVNPIEGANALKSATTRLLNPTKEAVTYFQETFNIDLPQIVEQANGNIYELMQSLAGLTSGFDNLAVQKGVGELFGTYQFNRVTALWTNLGDAVNGVQNQTAKAMETVGMSAEDLAAIADREIDRWQNSVSGKFKIAVESIKAALVPLGETVLRALTPVMTLIANMIQGFNELSGPVKATILIIAGLLAVAGPILMLAGIFANLFGNVVRMGTGINNLRLKFKAQTPEQAAMAISAKNATSAFNTEAQAAGHLATQIAALTAAMEANAVAQGAMVSASGRLITPATSTSVASSRTFERRANGTWGYGAGSVYPEGRRGARGQDLSGKSAGGHRVIDPADLAAAEEWEKRSAVVATNSEKARISWKGIAKAAGALTLAAGAIALISSGSDETLNTWINIGLTVATVAAFFPGLFPMIWKGLKIAGAYMGSLLGKTILMGTVLKSMAATTGFRAMLTSLGGIVGRAAKVFGPIGLLVLGGVALKAIVDDYQRAERHAKALAGAAKDWADVVGYTYVRGQLPGQEANPNGTQARIQLAQEMAEANEDLADAMSEVSDESEAYNMALNQAMQAITSGATPAEALRIFMASLEMMDIEPAVMNKLKLRFEEIDLENPEEIRAALETQMQGLFDEVVTGIEIDTQMGQDEVGLLGSFENTFRNLFGGDLTSEMRAAGVRAGAALATALTAAGDSIDGQASAFNALRDQANEKFKGIFETMVEDNDELGPIFEQLGIETADQFMEAMKVINDKIAAGDPLSEAQTALLEQQASDPALIEFQDSYNELLDTIVDGMVEAGAILPSKADEIREAIGSILGLKIESIGGDFDPMPMMNAVQASEAYSRALGNAEMHGRTLSEAEKLVMLNAYRARAGMGAATSVADGFGLAAAGAANDVDALAAALDNLEASGEEIANTQRDAMGGAWNDLLEEADRRFSEHQANVIDGIRDQGEATQEQYERDADNMAASFEAREKAMNESFQNLEDQQNAMQESRRKATEASYDARIEKINNAIEAEEKAEDKRKAIFEAEQTRIQRAADRFRGGIDLGVALRTGDLDEAARISGDMAAKNQQWAIEDADRAASAAAEARQEKLRDEVEKIQAAKDAALEALSQREEAEDRALEARQKRAEEALRIERETAEAGLEAAKEKDRKATESAIEAAEAQADADRRGLADRLRALQEFVPQNEQELRDHITEVEAAYAEYGFDLTTQGQGWADEIGTALDTNIARAAAALQTDIKWKAIAEFIAGQVGEGMGMTMDQVVAFLKTGVFPANVAPAGRPWVAPGTTSSTKLGGGIRGPARPAFHSGGAVPYTGGKGYSQADRVGVPRSASVYPSEVPTVLRVGEFVMNSRATRENREALEAMNKGKNFPSTDNHAARHSGGFLDYTAALFGLQQAAAMKVAEMAVRKKIEIAKAQAAAAAAAGAMGEGILGGGNAGSGVFSTSGVWPRAIAGVISPNTAGAVAKIKSMFPQITSVGTVGSRPNASDHPMGKAADFMIPNWNTAGGISLGDAVARYFIENPNAFGTKYVIWRKRITEGGGWTPYTHPNGETTNPTLNHYDHVHTSFRHKGGAAGFQLPNLNRGGIIKYDNTLANLHKNEAILTEPLTTSLRENVGSVNNAGDKTVIDLRGAYISQQHVDDIERIIDRHNEKKERRNGRNRKI